MKLSKIFKKQLKLLDKRIREQIKSNNVQVVSLKTYQESVTKLYDDALKGEAK